MALTDRDRHRLAQILGLCGSEHTGEIAAAGRMAHQIIRAANATWYDLCCAAPQQQPQQQPQRTWRDVVLDCQPFIDLMTPWECTFVWSLACRGNPLTDRQSRTLRGISKKLGVAWISR